MKSLDHYLENRKSLIGKLGFSEKFWPQLKDFLALLCSANNELNLISRKMTYEELIDNHLIDCLLPLNQFPDSIKTVADFGAGGGLPGVLYAIQFPHMEFHLFEKSNRKQEFLQSCQSFVPNITIRGEISSDMNGVDLVIARAFKPIDVILDMSRSYYQAGGKYFLFKGRREKIDEEIDLATKQFKALRSEIVILKSPVLEVERHLVRIS